MRLTRSHGLGNDYLVLETGEALSPDLVQGLCDRNRGVGGDGILEPIAAADADYGVRIWNPDGSVAEKSGNGIRIFAQWLVDRQGASNAFSVWTGFDTVSCQVGPDAIAVEMGTATFAPGKVPFNSAKPMIDGTIPLDSDAMVNVVVVSVGNPHCVVFTDADLDTLPWRTWGPLLETHALFPNRTNVQFARIVDEHAVEIRIWERGAGETQASGSSSCGVAAAAVKSQRLSSGTVHVHMPGGALDVTVRPDWSLLLTGPVEVVGTVEVDPRWLAARYTPGVSS